MGRLQEHPERRTWTPIRRGGWTGKQHIRFFTCAPGDLAAVLAEDLVLGAVLPEKWGGVSTSRPQDPMLQQVQDKRGDRLVELTTVWISIDVVGAGNTYAECADGRTYQDGADEKAIIVTGVAKAYNSAGIPQVGQTLAGGTPIDAIGDYICDAVLKDERQHSGRVFVRAQYSALVGVS